MMGGKGMESCGASCAPASHKEMLLRGSFVNLGCGGKEEEKSHCVDANLLVHVGEAFRCHFFKISNPVNMLGNIAAKEQLGESRCRALVYLRTYLKFLLMVSKNYVYATCTLSFIDFLAFSKQGDNGDNTT